MSSEGAGVHTSGALNREKAEPIVVNWRDQRLLTVGDLLDALEACVVPDPRLARIEALLEQAVGALRRKGDGEQLWTDAAEACIAAEAALAILRNQ